MTNIVPFPPFKIEQPISEAHAMVRILIAIHEHMDDEAYARLRSDMTGQLYLILDKTDAAANAMPALYPRVVAS